jgi:putative restriction endonuclease
VPTPFEHLHNLLKRDTWSVVLESSDRVQPKLLTVTRGSVVLSLRVYIWKVTRGGPAGFRPDTEFRIQRTSDVLQIGGGRLTLLLGWYELGDIFVAWNPASHMTAGYSPSIQVRKDLLEEAYQRGIAIRHREHPPEDVVAVTADHFSFYLEQAPAIHGEQFTGFNITFPELDTRNVEDETEISEAERPRAQIDRVPSAGTLGERRRIATKRTSWIRSSTFPRAVIWAYNYNCAVCGISLDLIEAAHIVPISDPETIDHPSNGLALCPLHHDAYDEGIFGVTGDFRIVQNPTKINELESRNLEAGLGVFLSITRIGEDIRLPDYVPYRPNPELLRYSLMLRGFR